MHAFVLPYQLRLSELHIIVLCIPFFSFLFFFCFFSFHPTSCQHCVSAPTFTVSTFYLFVCHTDKNKTIQKNLWNHNIKITQTYKDRIRAELDKQLKVEFEKRTSAELNQAVPPTETLNVEAAKEKAGLARQGSLVDRQPPSSLVQKRQLMNDQANYGSNIPMMEDDVSKNTL